MKILWTIISLAFLALAARGEVLNITAFGGAGDAQTFNVTTVSNSWVVKTGTVISSPIGKDLEIFGVGKQSIGVNTSGVNATNYLDSIFVVTNVTSGTNLYLKPLSLPVIPQQSLANAFAVIGTDNSLAISNAIAAASTNASITFPPGVYFCNTYPHHDSIHGYAYAAVVLNRGGLHFIGTNATMLSRGAFVWSDVTPFGTNFVRGHLFEVAAPVTNNFPVTVENLTLDGGLVNANLLGNPGTAVNTVDGHGWDQQHSAWLSWDFDSASGSPILNLTFTNDVIQHWQGEMLKTIDQNTNATVNVVNCNFNDGQATAFNMWGLKNFTGNTVSNVYALWEIIQSQSTHDSLIASNAFIQEPFNNAGNMASFDGLESWTAVPNTMVTSNYFYAHGPNNDNVFMFAGAANTMVSNNVIDCANGTSVFILTSGIGVGNTVANSNICAAYNTVICSNAPGGVNGVNLLFSFGSGAADLYAAYNVLFNGNIVEAPNVQVPVQCWGYVGCSTTTITNNVIGGVVTNFVWAGGTSSVWNGTNAPSYVPAPQTIAQIVGGLFAPVYLY